ncbi:MAG: hypothetical protein ACI85N_000456 [Gammaproteobacteria bacterium]|jgi:hypothetical protein
MLVEIIHKQHLDLREVFAQHQEALLQGHFEEAITLLNNFNLCHESHAKLEERYIFPLFEKIDRQSKWDVSLYIKEHEKIERLFENISKDVDWLSEQSLSKSQFHRNIIALLDKEKTFKGLTEHHEEREEEAMLKELEEQLEPSLIKELVSDLKFTWVEIVGSFKQS